MITPFDPDAATPEDVEQLIDERVARFDEEIAALLARVEDLRANRKRWLSVTGGRSRGTPEDAAVPLLTP